MNFHHRVVAGAVALATVTPAGALSEPRALRPSVATQPSIAALVPKAIAARGALRIGTDPTLAPLEFSPTPGAPITGADVELATAVATVLGLKATFVQMPFFRLFAAMNSNTIDVAWSSMTDTASREQSLSFVDYLATGERFFSRKGFPALKAPAATALCGKSVIVANSTVQVTQALALWTGCLKAKLAGVTLRSVPSVPTIATQVENKVGDYGFTDAPICAYAVSTSHGALVAASPIFYPVHYGVAANRGAKALTAAVSAAMNYLIRTGTYGQILAKWGLSASAMGQATINRP